MSRSIAEHSTQKASGPVYIELSITIYLSLGLQFIQKLQKIS